MISMVILDRKKEEADKLENCFRDISAHMSDERLALRKCEAGPEFLKYVAQTSLIHMAVLDFTAKDVPEAARGFRQAKPHAVHESRCPGRVADPPPLRRAAVQKKM